MYFTFGTKIILCYKPSSKAVKKFGTLLNYDFNVQSLPIFGATKTSVLSTNAQLRFALVVIAGVLGSQGLALHI